MDVIYKNLYATLEFDNILQKISDYAKSDLAKYSILDSEPNYDIYETRKILNICEECIFLYKAKGRHPLLQFEDVTTQIKHVNAKGILSILDVCKIKRVLDVVKIAKSFLEYENIDNIELILKKLPMLERFTSILEKSIKDETILDSASPQLASIRQNIRQENNNIKDILENIIKDSKNKKALQESIITIRNDRCVVPIKSEYRSTVPGIVQDQSSTGSTLFIEPFAVVDANNRLKILQLQEKNEIYNILKYLSNEIFEINEKILLGQDIIAYLDVCFCKAEYSVVTNASKPNINDIGKIILKGANHPLIDKNKVVPLDISICNNSFFYNEKDEKSSSYEKNSCKILLITGPNTGGKTVAIKTVGICVLLASIGVFIPCENGSEVSLFDNIFCSIGDGQNIDSNFSTFSFHISELKKIVNNVTRNSLVLIDELGSGTDPQEGAAIALGFLNYLENVGCTAIITSHFGSLKEYATNSSSILNAAMQFDTNTMMPTYKLIIGVSGASNGMEIAKQIGLDECIINYALKAMDNSFVDYNNMQLQLQKKMIEIDKKNDELENLYKEQQKIFTELECKSKELEKKENSFEESLKKKSKSVLDEAKQRAQDIINELKEKLLQGDESALFEARIIKNKFDKIDNKNSLDKVDKQECIFREGDVVTIKSLDATGKIISINGSNIVVSIGTAKINCKQKDLEPILNHNVQKKDIKNLKHERNKKQNNVPNNKVFFNSEDRTLAIREILLLGFTVAEAEIKLDEFIKFCKQDGITEIRIVHGKGSGILGRGVQEYLRTNKNIKYYRFGRYGEGEFGVTIAEIK